MKRVVNHSLHFVPILSLVLIAGASVTVAQKRPRTARVAETAATMRVKDEIVRLISAGQFADAESLARTSTSRSPRIAEYHTLLGMLLDKKNDTAGAESEYRLAIKLDPRASVPRCEP